MRAQVQRVGRIEGFETSRGCNGEMDYGSQQILLDFSREVLLHPSRHARKLSRRVRDVLEAGKAKDLVAVRSPFDMYTGWREEGTQSDESDDVCTRWWEAGTRTYESERGFLGGGCNDAFADRRGSVGRRRRAGWFKHGSDSDAWSSDSAASEDRWQAVTRWCVPWPTCSLRWAPT